MEKDAKRKIKVLYFITGLDAGGAELMLEKTAQHLDKNKFSISVCSLTKGGKIAENLKKSKIKVYELGARHTYHFFFAVSKLRKIIKEEKPDILHCFMPHANMIGRFAGLGIKCKIISSIRARLIEKKIWNFFDYLTGWMVDVYTVNSRTLKKFVTNYGIKASKVHVIENGVDLSSLNITKNPPSVKAALGLKEYPVITSIANLRKQKDYPTLIRALKMVQDKMPVNLLIVGSGTEYEDETIKIKKMISSLKIKNAHFLGYRDDIPNILQITDVWASATLYEGQSNSLLEAMSMKKAIVTTNIPENSEVVRDKKEALLIPVKSPEKLAESIIKLIKNKGFAKKLGENAYKRVKKYYKLEKTIRKSEIFYKGLVR